jgi:hypothetical protein
METKITQPHFIAPVWPTPTRCTISLAKMSVYDSHPA